MQSEAPRLSRGRGGEPRAQSVPRSRIFPRPHSSDIADTTLPHALTLLLLGYSSETWWQSRLASSTRRFAQVSRQALPPLAASPARSRSALRRDTQPRELTHADQRPRPPLSRPQRRAATCAPHAAPLTRRPSRWLTHWPLCRRRLAFLVRLSYFEGGADRCTRQCRCRLDVSSIQRATLARWESIASSQRGVSTRGTQRQCAGTATGATVTNIIWRRYLYLSTNGQRAETRLRTACLCVSACVFHPACISKNILRDSGGASCQTASEVLRRRTACVLRRGTPWSTPTPRRTPCSSPPARRRACARRRAPWRMGEPKPKRLRHNMTNVICMSRRATADG